MTARAFQITLRSRATRIVRSIIAHNSVEALRIGIRMMPVLSGAEGPELDGPVGITCKPMRRIA